MIINQRLASGRRVLCASPDYIKRNGNPNTFRDLDDHYCLAMLQIRTPMTTWYFDTPEGERSIIIDPSCSCDDGALIRQWALQGKGIALKAIWDVANDLSAGRLVTVLDKYNPDYQSKKKKIGSDLYIAYQDKRYLPKRTKKFIDYTIAYFKTFEIKVGLAISK